METQLIHNPRKCSATGAVSSISQFPFSTYFFFYTFNSTTLIYGKGTALWSTLHIFKNLSVPDIVQGLTKYVNWFLGSAVYAVSFSSCFLRACLDGCIFVPPFFPSWPRTLPQWRDNHLIWRKQTMNKSLFCRLVFIPGNHDTNKCCPLYYFYYTTSTLQPFRC